MAVPKKDLEIFLKGITLDANIFAGDSRRIADVKIIYPRLTVAQKTSSKTVDFSNGNWTNHSNCWCDTILFKENVQGDFGIEIAISDEVSSKDLENAIASSASTLVKLLGDVASSAVGIKALNSFVELPAGILAKTLTGSSYTVKTAVHGAADILGESYAPLKSGESTTISVKLLARRDIVKEIHRSSKSRTSISSRKILAKEGVQVGLATLSIRAL